MAMRSRKEALRQVLVDLLTVNAAWSLYYWFRIQSGFFTYAMEPEYWVPMIAICLFWLLVFFLFGLYRSWYAKSRLDELTLLGKAVVFGVLVLFFLIFFDDRGTGSPFQSRLLIAVYWVLMMACVGGGRMLQHTFQRRLLEAGVGLRNTVIVGWESKARELLNAVLHYPALGYRVVGFVAVTDGVDVTSYRNVPVLGSVANLPAIIGAHDVKDVLIALDTTEHDKLLSVISSCNAHEVSLKIIPDLYDIISGQARTNQIYGFPLIEIMPEIMQPWELAVKRTMDIVVSSLILVVGLPVWLLVALAVKLESRGPIFYTQERVGKDEKHFKIIKFRSMDAEAEKDSGPVWANKKDPRVTRVGKILRRTRLDEIPQFINVLDGNMSLIGPRPERPFFVEQLSKEIPLYRRRLKVRPGITGWAQVKHKYDESIDDVRKKVEYDLYYIENMSIRMDLKILLNTIAVVLLGKGH
jgi:exopolysaccharide biosynthesis polyprenyl glycosylphosphotransferase